jgi:hypothetical protein
MSVFLGFGKSESLGKKVYIGELGGGSSLLYVACGSGHRALLL